ncbi:hypothetical protein A1O3_02196 [Capronia epimyces CBS 606.96]|uniref:Transcription factor domain-containing protein n=1 Tax=Capronia epimyces CBS 606.96 TaxID=1182542 RepID=W9Y8F4_9EURO|nr:uncharacterized protein A1O3_02196 [Capronia epimyces CBS 606.96]EXJ89132.1 hypothetical protein A1O3_02196 [Capronia epimyces CBS 606.96]
MSMYKRGYEESWTQFGLAEKSRTMIYDNLPLSEDEPTVTEEVVTLRFLAGTMVWLDIASSVTVGTTPYLLSCHCSLLAPTSQTRLENVMGCENWVMLQIGRIAALHEHKTQALQQGDSDWTAFEQQVGDIGREIERGPTQQAFEGFNISEGDSPGTVLDAPTLVTCVFTYMASIYLHLVTHGFQKLEALGSTISRAMKILQTRVSGPVLPGLVLPLYILGSVARHADQGFFRCIFSCPPLLDPTLQHRARILPILEEIWSRRKTTPDFTWKDSLEVACGILLV